MAEFSESTLTEAVLETLKGTEDARLKEVAASLVRHLHGFIREVRPTEAEWQRGLDFLAEVGRMCDDRRQEFNLLSDILGATMLVDFVNHAGADGASESSVLGPFYRDGAAEMAMRANISRDGVGDPVIVAGRITDTAGAPLAGALLDVWQTSPNGLYENQDPDQPDMNLRARFRTARDGAYAFRTVKPFSYPIPHDGPAGKLLRALGRHPYRPAHIHFIVSAKGFEPLTTQLFVDDDDYLDSDAVFGVKDSLVVGFRRHDSADEARGEGVSAPFYTVAYDFALRPAR